MRSQLLKMLSELQEYKNTEKDSVWYNCVKDRLEKSTNNYLSDLELSYSYLMRRNDLNLLRKMNTYDKKTNR